MNTVLASQRLARHLNIPDATALPLDASLDVLAALNAGLQAFYRGAPAYMRRTTLSEIVREPQEVEVEFSAQYANTLTTDAFTDAMRGRSVLLPNGQWSEITGANTILDGFTGEVLTGSANVWSDAIQIPGVIQRFVSHVRLYDALGGILCDLQPGESRQFSWCRVRNPHQTGQPQYYWMQHAGAAMGADPSTMLRIWPMPQAVYTVRFEAEMAGARVTFAQLTNAAEIPVPDDYVEDILLPLCEAALVKSRFWRDAAKITLVLQEAEVVKSTRLRSLPQSPVLSSNRIGTPEGF